MILFSSRVVWYDKPSRSQTYSHDEAMSHKIQLLGLTPLISRSSVRAVDPGPRNFAH